jgi:serine/threonine-protein kinase
MLQAGTLFGGRYRLVRELGRGGMGVVWQARNEAISRDVAIKLMAPALAASEVSLARFFNEARICGSIRHPGVVDVLDLGRAPDGTPFLVMELLHGTSLEDLIARRGRLPIEMACQVVRDVAATVALAHERGVVHRDLKPANIFLHDPGFGPPVAKVLDFGISKVIGAESTGNTTGTGGMLGTPSYMSPEHAGGRLKVDHRTDVYALGVILYEALTGKLPYDGPTPHAILIDIATRDPTPIVHHAPGLPPIVVQVVGDAMARDRERRLPSALALAARLDAAAQALGLRAYTITASDLDASTVAIAPRDRAEMAATTPAPGTSSDHTLPSEPGMHPLAPRPGPAMGTVSPVSSAKRATAPTRLGGQVALGAALTITAAIAWAGWRAYSARTSELETGSAGPEVTAPATPASATADPATPATAEPAATGASASTGTPAPPSATASASPSVSASASSTPAAHTPPTHPSASPNPSASPSPSPSPKASAKKPNGQGMWGYE